LTATCFGPQVAIVRLYTLKKYLDVEISTSKYL